MKGYLVLVYVIIQYLLIIVTFGQAVPLGSNCSQQDACEDSNSVCSSGKCVCQSTHYDNNGVNLPGGTCTAIEEFQEIRISLSDIQTSQFTVSWTLISNKAIFISSYTIQWRATGSSVNDGSRDITTYSRQTIKGLTAGRAYEVKVISRSSATQTGTTRVTSARKTQAAKPGITSGIDFPNSDRDIDSGRIKVAWFAPSGYWSSYKVRLLDGPTEVATANATSTSTYLSDSGLKNGYRYVVTIQAYSQNYDNGKTVPGDTFSADFETTSARPYPPTASTCYNPTDGSINLSWSAPAPDKQNWDIVQYHIHVYKNRVKVKTENTTIDVTTFIVGGLEPGTHYTFRVYTENELGVSTSYDSVSTGCKTKAKTPESIVIERNCTTKSAVIGVILGLIIVVLFLYAGYVTLLNRRYRANIDGSENHKVRKLDSKGPMYANESFVVESEEAAEGPINPALNRDPETEYSKLDDNTRNDKATYDIIQAM